MNTKQLQQVLIVSSAIGILIVGVLVAVLSIFPLYAKLTANKQRTLQLALQTRVLKIEGLLSHNENIAHQITRSTATRQVLNQYNQGQISQNQAAQAISAQFQETLQQSEEIIGISRFDQNGELLVQVGLAIPQTEWVMPSTTTQTPQILNPIQLKENAYFVVAAPIIDQNQRIGTDLVLFQFTPIENIIKAADTHSEITEEIAIGTVQSNQQVQLFSPLQNLNELPVDQLWEAFNKATRGKSGLVNSQPIEFPQNVTAFEPIAGTNWGLAIGIESQKLYAPVHRLLLRVGGVIILLILAGTGTMLVLLHPLAGQVMIRTDELEQQLQYKTLALQELN
jgi:hypothetical protein